MTTLADDRSEAAGGTRQAVREDVPVRADGVQLLGEQQGSGYRTPPALARRADGQVLQLTTLLYAVLTAMDGVRTYDEVAAAVSDAVGRSVVGDDVRMLTDRQLRPLGLLRLADGSSPEVRKANPLLALRLRFVISDPSRTRRLTAPFAALFHPLAVVAVTLAFAVVTYWVLFRKGLASAAHQAFTSPGMLLAVFAITVASAGFHEFGHAAALRRGGGTPGAMGGGLYLVWPAFYTDVSDSYRLGRGARLRTDLGGLYFNAIVALAMFAGWAVIGWDGLLLVIATQILQMIRQLPPMLRFDGYHILADAVGVPDLFHRIGPTLAGLWPTRWRDPEARALKPWARAVVTLWVLVVVPLLLLTALVTVLTLPRILASAWHSFATQGQLLGERWQHNDFLGVGAKTLALIAVALPVFGVCYMLGRSVRQLVGATLRRTKGKPVRRTLAAVVAAAVLAALTWAWWPHGNYRPISANEHGVLQQALAPVGLALPVSQSSQAAVGVHDGQRLTAHTVWPAHGAGLPTPGHPALAMVLTPRDPSRPTWVFPFNRPAPPGAGDNQAMAIATRDGSVVYDVAFAMVTASSDTVLNRNEAYAFASCTGCKAVAISFQVVLVVGNAHVSVPQNISAAVAYNCIRCMTAAMSLQLVVSTPGPLDASTSAKLAALWAEIRYFGRHMGSLKLSQIRAQLLNYEKRIMQIVAPAAASSAAASSAAGPSGAVGTTAPGESPGGTGPQGATTSATAGSDTASAGNPATSSSGSGAPSSSDTPTPSATVSPSG